LYHACFAMFQIAHAEMVSYWVSIEGTRVKTIATAEPQFNKSWVSFKSLI